MNTSQQQASLARTFQTSRNASTNTKRFPNSDCKIDWLVDPKGRCEEVREEGISPTLYVDPFGQVSYYNSDTRD